MIFSAGHLEGALSKETSQENSEKPPASGRTKQSPACIQKSDCKDGRVKILFIQAVRPILPDSVDCKDGRVKSQYH
jgi:hypothetical protein